MACISHANLAMIDQEARAIIKQAVYCILVFIYLDGALMKEVGEIVQWIPLSRSSTSIRYTEIGAGFEKKQVFHFSSVRWCTYSEIAYLYLG
jgi:hypothetical protein